MIYLLWLARREEVIRRVVCVCNDCRATDVANLILMVAFKTSSQLTEKREKRNCGARETPFTCCQMLMLVLIAIIIWSLWFV